LTRAAAMTEGLLHDPPPFVLIMNLDNYYVSYEINGYTSRQNELIRIYSDFMKNILDVFGDAEVEILSPQYTVLRLGRKVEGQTMGVAYGATETRTVRKDGARRRNISKSRQ